MNENYKVEVLEKVGTLNKDIFEKMIMRGDVVAKNVGEIVGEYITVTGFAEAFIDLGKEGKEPFNIYYFNTLEKGIIYTGSSIFYDSVMDYMEYGKMLVSEIKLKQGQKTYKVTPDMREENNIEENNIEEGGEIND